MSQEQKQQNRQETQQPVQTGPLAFEPGHVMTRKHYENLAREAARQK